MANSCLFFERSSSAVDTGWTWRFALPPPCRGFSHKICLQCKVVVWLLSSPGLIWSPKLGAFSYRNACNLPSCSLVPALMSADLHQHIKLLEVVLTVEVFSIKLINNSTPLFAEYWKDCRLVVSTRHSHGSWLWLIYSTLFMPHLKPNFCISRKWEYASIIQELN